jgi:hypothetical protein
LALSKILFIFCLPMRRGNTQSAGQSLPICERANLAEFAARTEPGRRPGAQHIDSIEEAIERSLKTMARGLARQMHKYMRDRDIHYGIAYSSASDEPYSDNPTIGSVAEVVQ